MATVLNLDNAEIKAAMRERVRTELKARQDRKALYDTDFRAFAADCLSIRPKDGAEKLFRLNAVQRRVHQLVEEQLKRTGKVRAIVLKARQPGVSTYVSGRYYHRTSRRRGLRAFILTHGQDATDSVFEMVKRFHERNPEAPHTGAASAKELIFDALDSGFEVGTAGSRGLGRGYTIQLFHGCVAEGTKVVDQNGNLKNVEAFRVGDIVRTHRNALAPISFISSQIKDCFEITMRGLRCFPLVLTGEHRMWTRTGWQSVSALDEGDTIGFPVREITSDLTHLPFLTKTAPRPQGGGKQQTGPDAIHLDYNLGRIIGLYLAEGTVVRQWKSKKPSAITFTVHEDEVERTVQWLNCCHPDLFLSISILPRRDSKTVTVTAYSTSLGLFVKKLVGVKDNKRLPHGWWTMGEDFVRGMVHGYLCGDGYFSPKRDRRISATSIRETITLGMRDALASLGYGWASIELKPAAVRAGRNERAAYTLRLTGTGVETLSKECGKPFVERKRPDMGNYGTVRVEDGYAWIPIVKKVVAGVRRVFDFEISHSDHSYCLLHGATHNSEVAYWPTSAEHAGGILQAVPNVPGSEIILESTANGLGGLFHNLCMAAQRGQSEYMLIFIPWFEHDEYAMQPPDDFVAPPAFIEYAGLHRLTAEQLYWAYTKNADMASAEGEGPDEFCWQFQQEYPATVEEAFRASRKGSFITGNLVLKARRFATPYIENMPIALGVDLATGGDGEGGDQNVAIDRQGRKAGGHVYERNNDKNTITTASWLSGIINRVKPDMTFIDPGGGGAQVYDILISQGFDKLVLVPFGSKPRDERKYANKRAEMWGDCRDWLADPGGADIPDCDILDGELTGPTRRPDFNDRIILERKEKVKERIGRSPDGADALALTFAEHIRHTDHRNDLDPAHIRRQGGIDGRRNSVGWMGM